MKRLGLVLAGLALAGAVNTADAQLTMQMSNGWSATFAGNVNAFWIYTDNQTAVDLTENAEFTSSGKTNGIGTGLLPSFFTFEAKGKEGDTDLGIHFGFAPQVSAGRNVASSFGTDAAGAQIDMRQVYLTVGGTWGQILAGREIGLFNRQNILTDQTLFGIGATGGINGGGTTLGRIGFGYIYPNFVAQMTYSTPAGRPTQISIGIFQPASLAGDGGEVYDQTQVPRVEAELVYSSGNVKGWVNGTAQNAKNTFNDESKTAAGVGGGLRFGNAMFSLTGSGYWGKGIGTTLQFNGVNPAAGSAIGGLGVGDDGELRNSYGFIGQITVTPANSKVTLAGSFGSSYLKATDGETAFKTENSLISGGIYYQATKSLKVVGEGNYAWTKDKESTAEKNKTFAPTIGLMLFF